MDAKDIHGPGEVLGDGLPDWPEDLQTFAERHAYQRGVGDARRHARKADLDVRTILLRVVPGDDGEGLEVYAESTEDVVALLTKQAELIEDLQSRLAAPCGSLTTPAEGWVLVPKRMTQEMRDVTDSEGWTWEDLLAEAGSISQEEYAAIAAAPVAPAGLLELLDKRCGDSYSCGLLVDDIKATLAAPVAPAQLGRGDQIIAALRLFRKSNVARCNHWHAPGDINSWSSSDWITAIVGELGEMASLIKMRNRERDGLTGNKFSPTNAQVGKEGADVFTYLDLFLAANGIDLGEWIVSKFNEVSERNGFEERL